LNVVYWLIVEHMDADQRAEVDEFLAGPRRRRRDVADLAGLGGDIVAAGGGGS
jgi:hypothetical protein